MARDSSGVYSLPTPQTPFIIRTVISATDMNTVQSDLANELTQSLDRNGKGDMLAPIRPPAGTVSLPSHTFSTDTNTGMYSVGADQLGFATGGALRLTIASALATCAVPLGAPDGAVGAPGLTFSGDLDSGIYRVGANDVRFAVNGAQQMKMTTSGINIPALDGDMTITGALAVTAGLTVTQSVANTAGGTITGNGNAVGLTVNGGSGGGTGLAVNGGGTNGDGATILPKGTGIGLTVSAAAGTGQALQLTGNATKAPLKLVSLVGDPSSGTLGDLYVTSTGKLKVYDGSSWVVVGTQT